MKRYLSLIALTFIVIFGYGQNVIYPNIDDICKEEKKILAPPADCSIEHNTSTIFVWRIQVGVYYRMIASNTDIIREPGIDEEGNACWIYFHNRLFNTKDEAKRALALFQSQGRFCDAFTTLYTHGVGFIK